MALVSVAAMDLNSACIFEAVKNIYWKEQSQNKNTFGKIQES